MHPKYSEGFEWDEWNTQELNQPHHPIREWEAEEVFWNRPVWARNKRAGSGDWLMIGWTDAGRPLTLVVTVNSVTRDLRVITGWDSTRGERTRYLDKRSQR
jgi:uncharacterized DUF497 family protein